MSDAAGELAHRLHLLGLSERFLRLQEFGFPFPLSGNAASVTEDLLILQSGTPRYPAKRPILGSIAILKSVEVAASAGGRDGARCCAKIVRPDQLTKTASNHFVGCVTQDLF